MPVPGRCCRSLAEARHLQCQGRVRGMFETCQRYPSGSSAVPGAGVGVQWVPSADGAAVSLLRKHRWQRAYVDVQVACDLPLREPPPAVPQGVSLHRSRGEPDLRAVHDLICAAWGTEPHWEEFLERLVMRRSYDPSLWCLAAAGKRLVGVVIGEVESEI